MNRYVMSDIHGCFNKFKAMLEKINFNENDELYILGDIFDRGDNALDILDYVLGYKNIFLLKGNHEKMFEEYYETRDTTLWYYNGGKNTHMQIIEKGMREADLYNYIKKLPYIKVIDKFILVHASVIYAKDFENMSIDDFISSQEEDSCIWDRINIGKEKKFKDYTVICGHTPVQSITNNNNNNSILHREGTIYIDCGAVFKHVNGRLACLNIDTMEEYYV